MGATGGSRSTCGVRATLSPCDAPSPARTATSAPGGATAATIGASCSAKIWRRRCAAASFVAPTRSSACRVPSSSQRARKYSAASRPTCSRGIAPGSGSRSSKSAAAANRPSLEPKYRMTIDGSIPASAAMARIVALSYPSVANLPRAAARIAARVASERRGLTSTLMPTSVGQRVLTCRHLVLKLANKRWPTTVGRPWRHEAMNESTDVVIVGAGPTGLLLAGDLAAAGVSVTVLERRPEHETNLTRAFAVHARTREVPAARGLADELLARGARVGQLQFLRRLRLGLGGLPSRYPFLLVTPQYEVEQLLERRAVAHGARIRPGVEMRDLRQDGEGVDVITTDGSVRARYVVGTDGVRSTVRRALGLPFPGRTVARSVLLADVRLAQQPSDVLAANADGETFGFLAPFGDG